jgi:histone-lysine N-methyltransferase SETD3
MPAFVSIFSLLILLQYVSLGGAADVKLKTKPDRGAPQNKLLGTFVAPDTKLEAVFAWVQKHGGKGLDNIRIALFDKAGHSVRGLAATRDLAAHSEVLSIPESVILKLDHPSVRDSPFQKVDVELGGLLLKLPLYLAAERRKLLNGKSSFWAPWIESLPTPAEFASFHPYYAKPGVMSDFAALPLTEKLGHDIESTEKKWEENKQQWISLAQSCDAEGLTFEDFKWACTIVWTRSYSGLSPGNNVRGGLVPISDLGNHAASPSLDWSHRLNGNPPTWSVLASRDIKKGEELTESYGDKNNEVLLWTYGFAMAGNPVSTPQLSKDECGKLQAAINSQISDDRPQAQILRSLQALSREQCGIVGQQSKTSFLGAYL